MNTIFCKKFLCGAPGDCPVHRMRLPILFARSVVVNLCSRYTNMDAEWREKSFEDAQCDNVRMREVRRGGQGCEDQGQKREHLIVRCTCLDRHEFRAFVAWVCQQNNIKNYYTRCSSVHFAIASVTLGETCAPKFKEKENLPTKRSENFRHKKFI